MLWHQLTPTLARPGRSWAGFHIMGSLSYAVTISGRAYPIFRVPRGIVTTRRQSSTLFSVTLPP